MLGTKLVKVSQNGTVEGSPQLVVAVSGQVKLSNAGELHKAGVGLTD